MPFQLRVRGLLTNPVRAGPKMDSGELHIAHLGFLVAGRAIIGRHHRHDKAPFCRGVALARLRVQP